MKGNLIKLVAESKLPTKYGNFIIRIYKDAEKNENAVLIKGKINKKSAILVRLHSECLTGEVFHSLKCDCREQLEFAMDKISKNGGVIVYLRQEGRGIGLGNKIKAYSLQDQGYDTVEANIKLGFAPDLRVYNNAVAILRDLGVKKIKLLTNNPEKVKELSCCGLNIVDRVPLEIMPNSQNKSYLKVKKNKMGHWLENV